MVSQKSISAVMITKNEAHNMDRVLKNLGSWADEIIVLDSYSTDQTCAIAKNHGARLYKRKFDNFGSHWNFFLTQIEIKTDWVIKIDPDEILSDELKLAIKANMSNDNIAAMSFPRLLFFFGKPLNIKQQITRVWRNGSAHFTDAIVNEHVIVDGKIKSLTDLMLHFDSPSLEHWIEKQNRYSSMEAIALAKNQFAYSPRLFGNNNERRMWLKKHFRFLPGRFLLIFIYYYVAKGLFLSGYPGYVFSRLRADVMRYREYKFYELKNKTKD